MGKYLTFNFIIIILILVFLIPNLEFYHSQFHSADHYYLPALFLDIQENFSRIQEWNLQPAPGFLPDWFLYYPIHIVFSSHPEWIFSFYSLVYGIVLLLTSVGILNSLPGSYEEKKSRIYWFYGIFSLLLTLTAMGWTKDFLSHLFLITHHSGSMLFSLILLLILLRKKNPWSLPFILFLMVLIGLGRFSDGYFLILFMIPFVLSYMSSTPLHYWRSKLLVAILFLTLIKIHPWILNLGESIFHIPRYQPAKMILEGIKNHGLDIPTLFNQSMGILENFSALDIGFFFLLGMSFFIPLKHSEEVDNSYQNQVIPNPETFLKIFFLSFASISLVSIVLISKYFSSDLLTANRYYAPTFYILILNSSISLPRINFPKYMRILPLIFLFLTLTHIYANKTYQPFQPHPLSCLNQIFPKNSTNPPLKGKSIFGLGDYWDSKPIFVMSRGRFAIQAMHNAEPDDWITRKNWLKKGELFYFILEREGNRMDSVRLLEKYPRPSRVVECKNTKIHVYDEGIEF